MKIKVIWNEVERVAFKKGGDRQKRRVRCDNKKPKVKGEEWMYKMRMKNDRKREATWGSGKRETEEK